MSTELKKRDELPAEMVAYAEVIKKAAADPDVDVNKLEKLLDMQERVMSRGQEMAFNAAMSAAQGEMSAVVAKSVNPQTRSKYAKYGALDKMLRPIYIRHGFAISYGTAEGAPPEYVRVVADVSHSAGHSKHYHIDIPADGKGAKGGDVMTKTHAVGAGTSYGVRYLLKMIFNIAIILEEDDQDGNESYEKISEKQAADLRALAEETRSDIPKFCQYFKVDKLENLPASVYQSAIKAFEKKRGRK